MSDRLSLLSSHSMFCYIGWLWLCLYDYYCIYFNYLDDACFMHVIVVGAKLFSGLIKMAKIIKIRINC
jgi:hypothetical protein